MIRQTSLDDSAAIARVHVDSWRATYRGLLPDERLTKLTYEGRERLCVCDEVAYGWPDVRHLYGARSRR